jgi:ABC-type polysaccharide/polyol phosphate export permease
MLDFLRAIFQSKKMLLELIKNDLKQRFVGNFLGVFWAFIQPAVSVLVMWFVFQVGFKSQPVGNMPFILWLIAGMFPWFFFADALQNGTNAIMVNNFLVKKVVFRVSMLPIIPLSSALIVHAFFILVMFAMFIYYGFMPQLYWLQIAYYLFATYILMLGLTWITSSVVVFFKYMGQLVGIVIQIGFWATPIFWSMSRIPQKYHIFIELNPMAYIIEGYRNSMIHHKWFWQNAHLLHMTLYFWVITVAIFILGALIFRKLRPHFAEVL